MSLESSKIKNSANKKIPKLKIKILRQHLNDSSKIPKNE